MYWTNNTSDAEDRPTDPTPKAPRRPLAWVLPSSFALLTGACGWLPVERGGGRAASVAEAPALDGGLAVQRGDLVTRTLLTGMLVAEDAEQLVVPNADIWPVQVRWLAEDGVEVSKGDKVVEFDNSQLTANLEELRANSIAAANQLANLEAQADAEIATASFTLEKRRAEVEKARLEAAVPRGVLAERQYQQRQLDLEKAELALAEAEAKLEATRRSKRAEIEVQRLALEETRSEVARSEARIELLTLEASRDGILILDPNRREGRTVQVGDGVFPGSSVGSLPDLSTMIVEARLFDVDDGRVAPGMDAVAILDAFPELTFAGRVREVDPIADQPSSRSLRRVFRVRIDLDRLDLERMRPGMSVKVVIEERHPDVLLVPRECLEWRDDGPRALRADGTWASVSLGACGALACVVEAGLEVAAPLARTGRGEDAARTGAGVRG